MCGRLRRLAFGVLSGLCFCSHRNVRVGSCVTNTSPEKEVWSCTRAEGRPLEAGIQVQASNHRKVLSLRAIVVSVAGKVGTISRLVRSGEASESKPSMTVRKGSDDVETGGGPISRDKLGGGPDDCPGGIRVRENGWSA